MSHSSSDSSDSSSDDEKSKKGEHQSSNNISQATIQNVARINLPVLNIGSIELPDPKFGVSFVLCGSTRSGKTTILNYLYKTDTIDALFLGGKLHIKVHRHISLLSGRFAAQTRRDIYANACLVGSLLPRHLHLHICIYLFWAIEIWCFLL
jgi:hypothetical protein